MVVTEMSPNNLPMTSASFLPKETVDIQSNLSHWHPDSDTHKSDCAVRMKQLVVMGLVTYILNWAPDNINNNTKNLIILYTGNNIISPITGIIKR